MDNMRALRQTRLFEAMPEAELAKLAALAKATRFHQGEEICREGASGIMFHRGEGTSPLQWA